ncbi:transcriptional regulator GcvA [Enterovibrio makurazakiensis]|uniref:Transcriptional regulator GcvA n=1 Tax=Enterovibrio gelatinilyticus TaxID=2899819 RepID=A0ABT5R1R6_9GAMM|nr:transcriptional regulator GcvA [Enterovibrio sp. ZSDZ42]MDD1793964.1 transcriptional regulator GcvA [Enterovibrio sp. ZSDZ42]
MEIHLPPLNALRAFESVARLLSIKAAAEELHVTPAAVSQQIKSLENYLDVQLLERKVRSIELTEAGEQLFPFMEEGFSKLEEGVRQLRRRQQSNELVVSASPTFAAKWLLPRLGSFYKAYPKYRLRVDACESLVNFRSDGVDVALRYGGGGYPNLFCQTLIPEEVIPVCSPALLNSAKPLQKPDDLRHHMLLRSAWQTGQQSAPCWGMWLRAAGLTDIDPDAGHHFSSEFLTLQAAIEGQGVALTAKALVTQDINAGKLVYPFGEDFNQLVAFSYFFVCPESHLRLKKVQAFKQWIEKEIQDQFKL